MRAQTRPRTECRFRNHSCFEPYGLHLEIYSQYQIHRRPVQPTEFKSLQSFADKNLMPLKQTNQDPQFPSARYYFLFVATNNQCILESGIMTHLCFASEHTCATSSRSCNARSAVGDGVAEGSIRANRDRLCSLDCRGVSPAMERLGSNLCDDASPLLFASIRDALTH